MKYVPFVLALILAHEVMGDSPDVTPATETAAVPVKAVTSVQTSIEKAVAELAQYGAIQKRLNIQNPDIAYAMKKALLLADLLLKHDGTPNLRDTSLVKTAFLSSQPEDYEVNMGKVIDQLSVNWRGLFSSIYPPVKENVQSTLALRALFQLAPEQAITPRHARVAVLAAMLAPYNQGPVGDCFAVNDVLRDHTEYFSHAAKDYRSIVMNGRIDRLVNGQTDSFYFLPSLADGDRDVTFPIQANGTFTDGTDGLFDAPGFAAAWTVMGGTTDHQADVIALVAKTAAANQGQVTASQVISLMAKVIAANMENVCSCKLTAAGEYTFSCLTNNPILRGVEAAFSAMAEDRANDSVRNDINTSIAQALQSTWSQLQENESAAPFQQALASQFDASYRLVYNLDIPLSQVSADGSSTDGGFQLYKRDSAFSLSPGTPVATPKELQQLVLDAIAATAAKLDSSMDNDAIASTLKSVVETEPFLNNVLWAYDPANKQEPNPVANYQKLGQTPMQSCDGDNPFEVDDIDTGVTYDNHVQSYTPKNAKDLLSWCLTLAKTAPAELLPMDSPQHAFNFVPANDDIAAFIQKKLPINEWIQGRIVAPGVMVSRKTIDPTIKQTIENALWMQVTNVVPKRQFQGLLDSISKTQFSVRDYANGVVNGLNSLLNSKPAQANQVALVVDALLLQNLSPADQTLLGQSAVRFANTNWNQGTKDIYFCAYFNPRTEQVGFGTIMEDKTQLQPMDETAWVNNQQWDVDLMPAAPKS